MLLRMALHVTASKALLFTEDRKTPADSMGLISNSKVEYLNKTLSLAEMEVPEYREL